jgi:hypothetical protein
MSEHQPSDKKAAYIGLVVTAVLLFLMSFTIVQLTNHEYAGREGQHAPAGK